MTGMSNCDYFDRELDRMKVAVLLDTEARIGCGRNQSGLPQLRVILEMSTEYYPIWMHKRFGGSIVIAQTENEAHSDTVAWEVSMSDCTKVLIFALPYLRLKHQLAELGLLFTRTIGSSGRKLSPEVRAVREKIYQAMKKLNERGHRRYGR